MRGVILAGGHATRLRPLTYTINKHLRPLANKPILFYSIEVLANAGIKDICIILGTNDPESVKKVIGDGSRFGIKVTYIMQGEPKGVAHAIGCAEEFVNNEPFIVYLGDNIFSGDLKRYINNFKKSDDVASLFLTKVKNPSSYGVAEVKNGKVRKFVEKPKKPKSNLAILGIYLLRSQIFGEISKLNPSWRNELEITEAFQRLIDKNLNVSVNIVGGYWKDTGSAESLLEANHFILASLNPDIKIKGEIEGNCKINGNVSIAKNTIIRAGCVIKGPVVIGENCDIGPNTYIGPYTSIGDNTIIKGGEIESSIIFGDTIVECGKRIVDSLIGRNSHIYSADNTLPKGYRIIIGENSTLGL